jgi:DNA repair protein RAD5
MIELRGTMVDCPASLLVGAELIVSLDVYIKLSAFESPNTSSGPGSKRKTMLNEGQETADEQKLRARKAALGRMFRMLGLLPVGGGRTLRKQETELDAADLRDMASQAGRGVDAKKKSVNGKRRTEIVGDGEEVEVDDDDGELSENQLDVIYRKYGWRWGACSALNFTLERKPTTAP